MTIVVDVTDASERRCQKLRAGDVLRFDVCRGMSIQCCEGRLWITQTNLGADIILGVGQIFEPLNNGTIVVQALEAACFKKNCNN